LFALFVVLSTSSRLEAGAWVQKAPVPGEPVGASAVALDGKIYVMGGVVTPSPSYDNTANVSVYDPVTNTWDSRASMHTARGFLATAVVNGKIYAIGGGYPTPVNSVEVYDPVTNTWTDKAPLPKPYEGTRAAVVNGIIYVVCGNQTDSTCYAYDPAMNVWTEKKSHPGLGVGTIAYKGLIYTFGGGPAPAGPVTNAVWAYDPQTNLWSSRKEMPTARAGVWTYVICGKIYVIGGYQRQNSSIAKVEVYDPATDTWTSNPDMPFASCFHTGAAVDGKIYVMAGTSDWVFGHGPNWEYEPCLDDPSACIWSKCSSLLEGRAGSCAAELDGKIYLLGGFGSGALDNTDLNTVFDPVTKTWETRKSMDTSRALLAAAAVDGRIYAIGGGYPQPIAKVAMYDPATDSWTSRKSLLKPYMGSRAAVVNGIIYVVGGNSGDSACYAYDPGSNQWTETKSHPSGSGAGATAYKDLIYTFGGGGTTGPVSAAVWAYSPGANQWTRKRDMPTARAGVWTYVVCGKIFVIGGFQTQNSSLAKVEVYDPATDTWMVGTDIPLTTCFATGAAIDGKIYVMAGTSDWKLGDQTIWIYNPSVDPKLTTGVEEVSSRPKVMVLEQNYPNPFNPSTRIKYTVGVASGEWRVTSADGRGTGDGGRGASNVRLVVYDLLGKEVAVLVNEKKQPGTYDVPFDGSGLASGAYIYRLTAGKYVESRKMLLLK
jgi:N-acetylneuraminic acid mutarotase